jgi:cobalt-precorrin 5A hydrolase
MELREAMVSAAIGIGCRRRVAASAIIDLVREALARLASPPDRVRLFTIERKADEAGLIEAATTLGYDLIALPEGQLARASADLLARGVRPSARARDLVGIDSVAEAAALLGAGPRAALVAPRMAANGVTCAIAIDRNGWDWP